MNEQSGTRLSPAMVIAMIALFAAIGGGSAIALNGKNTVDSGDIKPQNVKNGDLAKDSVTSVKVKDNNLSGNDINESSLGQVPSAASAASAASATNAVSATTANNANKVNNQTIIPINHRSGDVTDAVIATLNGLTLRVTCIGGTGTETITAVTAVPDGEIAAISNDALSTDRVATSLRGQSSDTFGPGDTFTAGPDGGNASERQYTVTYSAGDGRNVVATFVTEDFIGGNSCVVSGNAIG